MSYSRVPLSEQDADNQEYPPNHRSSGLSSILNSSTTASTTASTTSATTSSSSSATGGHRGITNNGINTNNNTNLLTRVWDNLASPFAASADPPHVSTSISFGITEIRFFFFSFLPVIFFVIYSWRFPPFLGFPLDYRRTYVRSVDIFSFVSFSIDNRSKIYHIFTARVRYIISAHS